MSYNISVTRQKIIYPLMLLVYLLISSWFAINKPFYSWDMLPYVALILSVEESDDQKIHQQTYALVRQVVTAKKYAESLGASAYQKKMAEDHAAFSQQLAFYKVRPLHAGLTYLLYKTGANPVSAILFVSVISSIMIGMIILRWLMMYLDVRYASLLTILIMPATGVLQIARAFTPDALSAALIILAVYLLSRYKHHLASIFLIASIFARTDNFIFVALVMTYMRFIAPVGYRTNGKEFVIYTGLAAISYLLINFYAGFYGWAAIFHHTLIGLIEYPASTLAVVNWRAYFEVLSVNSYNDFIWVNSFFLFALLSLLIVLLSRHLNADSHFYRDISLIIIIYIIIHYLLFPVMWVRFFIAHYTIICIGIIIVAFQAMPQQQQDPASKNHRHQ